MCSQSLCIKTQLPVTQVRDNFYCYFYQQKYFFPGSRYISIQKLTVSSIFTQKCSLISLTRLTQRVFSWDCCLVLGVGYATRSRCTSPSGLRATVPSVLKTNKHAHRHTHTHIYIYMYTYKYILYIHPHKKELAENRQKHVSNLYTCFGLLPFHSSANKTRSWWSSLRCWRDWHGPTAHWQGLGDPVARWQTQKAQQLPKVSTGIFTFLKK